MLQMAEFASMNEVDAKYATKNKANSALTLGIVGTALGSLGLLNNNNGCCGNGGGILGGLFGNNNNCCAMEKAQNAMTAAILEGQQADNLAWANRVASMQDDAAMYQTIDKQMNNLNTTDWVNRVAGMKDLADYATVAEGRFNRLNDQDWINRIQNMKDTADSYAVLDSKINTVDDKVSTQSQILTNQMYEGRIKDLQEKFELYSKLNDRDVATNSRISLHKEEELADKFQLFKSQTESDAAIDNKFTKLNYEGRIQDLNEKFDLYTRLNNKITELEKAQAKTETALPLMFELNKTNSERYTDGAACALQRQLDHKIDGQLKYAYSDLCAPVPSISPLYCTPFTPNGSGTTWSPCNNGCQTL